MKGRKHEWLRIALAERGHTQKDLAKAWGVDDAVVSRFINAGEPEPGVERLEVLGRMLDVGMDELFLRLREGLPLPRRAPPSQSAPRPPPKAATGNAEAAIAALKAAVERARAAGVKVTVHITREEEI
jgi:nucleotide-binding universal stress UspA family protein